jgi:hypothetical protein
MIKLITDDEVARKYSESTVASETKDEPVVFEPHLVLRDLRVYLPNSGVDSIFEIRAIAMAQRDSEMQITIQDASFSRESRFLLNPADIAVVIAPEAPIAFSIEQIACEIFPDDVMVLLPLGMGLVDLVMELLPYILLPGLIEVHGTISEAAISCMEIAKSIAGMAVSPIDLSIQIDDTYLRVVANIGSIIGENFIKFEDPLTISIYLASGRQEITADVPLGEVIVQDQLIHWSLLFKPPPLPPISPPTGLSLKADVAGFSVFLLDKDNSKLLSIILGSMSCFLALGESQIEADVTLKGLVIDSDRLLDTHFLQLAPVSVKLTDNFLSVRIEPLNCTLALPLILELVSFSDGLAGQLSSESPTPAASAPLALPDALKSFGFSLSMDSISVRVVAANSLCPACVLWLRSTIGEPISRRFSSFCCIAFTSQHQYSSSRDKTFRQRSPV